MKLKFTRKTWYFFLLAAAAVSMLGGFAVLSGMDFSALPARERPPQPVWALRSIGVPHRPAP